LIINHEDRTYVEREFAKLGASINWHKIIGTAYENNPRLLLQDYLTLRNALINTFGSAAFTPDDFLGSVSSGDQGKLTESEMRELEML
jgi:hypothetical protein